MIRLQTPDGAKNFLLRGILTPDGPKGIAAGRITAPDGDVQFWDATIHAALDVSCTPYVSGGGASFTAIPIDSNTALASAPGATPPVTWLWSVVSIDSGTWTILSPNASSTAFRATSVPAETMQSATFKVTATDARGATGEATVYVEVTNYGGV